MAAPGTPHAGDRWALFLDVDGTLLDLAPVPDAVEVPGGLLPLLARLRDLLGGALALVSGRRVAELDRLFHPERFVAAGVHGAELRPPDGPSMSPAGLPDFAPARAAFEDFVHRHPHARFEDKGVAVALHFRQAPDAGEEARRLAAAVADRIGPTVDVLRGKMVVELRPRGATKGRSVGTLLSAPPFAGRVPVYVGDDVTDEDAFAEVNRRGGLSVLAGGRSSSEARTRLAGPPEVRRWLAGVARSLAGEA